MTSLPCSPAAEAAEGQCGTRVLVTCLPNFRFTKRASIRPNVDSGACRSRLCCAMVLDPTAEQPPPAGTPTERMGTAEAALW